MVEEIQRILSGLDDRDRLIMQCARAEFAGNGFYNANMDRIAQAAGLGKGTLYRRFINKQILFFVTIHAGQMELIGQLSELDPALPLRQQLESYLEKAVGYIIENIDLLKLGMHEFSKVLEGLEHSELRAMALSLRNFQTVFWRRFIDLAAEKGYLASWCDREVIVSMLPSMMQAVYAEVLFCEAGEIKPEQIRRLNTMFIGILFEGLFRDSK